MASSNSGVGLDVLGGPSQKTKQIHQIMNNVKIVFPDPTNKTLNNNSVITMKDYYQGLTDDSCYWNIKTRMSERDSNRLTMIPPFPQNIKAKVGSLALTERRLEQSLTPDEAKGYRDWLKQVKPSVTENEIYLDIYDVLKNETGTIFQGFMTTNYAGILTSLLDKDVNHCIEHGLTDPWLEMGKWKGVDIQNIRFGNNKVSFVQFREALKNHEGDRDGLLNESVFKGHQTVLKLTTDVIVKYLSLKSTSTTSYKNLVNNLSDEQLYNAYKLSYIRNEGREVDLFVLLPARKAILHIEVKDGESKKSKDVNRNYKYAGEQLDAMKKWISTVHGDLFQGWRYISVAALPSIPANQLPSHDPDFVISKDTVDGGLDVWFSGLMQRCGTPANKPIDSQQYESYVEFTKRVIGFSCIDDDLRVTRLQVRIKIHRCHRCLPL